MLSIKNLTASINGTPVLKGIDLEIKAGEIHAIMGPNGSGKSTLGKVLAGHPAYEVTGGEVLFEGRDLFSLAADERARAGLFMGFQHPIEVPGVRTRPSCAWPTTRRPRPRAATSWTPWSSRTSSRRRSSR